jgi:hypothetical protein
MNKIILVLPALLALTLVSANGAPKIFSHTAAYELGVKEGQWDLQHGNPLEPGDICNQGDQDGINLTRCMQGYEDAVNTVLSAAYRHGYQMGLQDLKN